MTYFLFLIIGTLCFVIIGLIANFKISNSNFQKRVRLLEQIIKELKSNLENQNQKIKISEDLKMQLKNSKESLNGSIFELNKDLFEIITKNNLA